MQTDFENWSDDQLEAFVINRDPTRLVRLLMEQSEKDVQAELGAIVHYHRAQQLAALLRDYAARKRQDLPRHERGVAAAEEAQRQAQADLDVAQQRLEEARGDPSRFTAMDIAARSDTVTQETQALQRATHRATVSRQCLAKLLENIQMAEQEARLLAEVPRPELKALRIVLQELRTLRSADFQR